MERCENSMSDNKMYTAQRKIIKKSTSNNTKVIGILTIVFLSLLVFSLCFLLIPFDLNNDKLYVFRMIGSFSLYFSLSYFVVLGASKEIVNAGIGFTIFMSIVFLISAIFSLILTYNAMIDQNFFANKKSVLKDYSFIKEYIYQLLILYYVGLLILGVVCKLLDYSIGVLVAFIIFSPIVLIGYIVYLIYLLIDSEEEKKQNLALVIILLIGMPPIGIFAAIIFLAQKGSLDIEISSDSSTETVYSVYDGGYERILTRDSYDSLTYSDIYKDDLGHYWVQDKDNSDCFYKKD